MKQYSPGKPEVELGIVGALFMAVSIYLINIQGPFHITMRAAILQFIYSFIIITMNMAICRNHSSKNIFMAIMLPTTITTIFTFTIHFLNGSAQPVWSAIYAAGTAIFSFALSTARFRWSKDTITSKFMNLIRNLY